MAEIINIAYSFASNYLTNLVVAVIIILLGFIMGKIVGRLLQKILSEIELNNIIKKATHIKINLEEIISSFITYFIYFISIVMALSQLGLTTTVLNMISGAVIVVIIISIFLGIKDFVPNLIAGIFIHRKGFVNEGDRIRVKGIEGKIVHINLVETRIKTKKGDLMYVPNTMLTRNEVVKLKKSQKSSVTFN